ncbi:MAG: two-component sensor histidine kinase [Streptosporangiales bacterium]|nr:two-component sensor histidine kinase [Streptosporangiales bacterium]
MTRWRARVCSHGPVRVGSVVSPTRRDVWVAGGCLVLGVTLYLTGFNTFSGADPDIALGWRIAVLGLACVGQLWRSTRPLMALGIGLAAVAIDAWHGLTLPVLIVLADLLYTATLYAGRRASRLLVGAVGAAVVVLAVSTALLEHDWRFAMVMLLQVGLVLLVPVWWARNVRQQRELAEVQRERADQVARIAELDRRAAIAEERSRMARDLHDVVAGQLSAIAIQSEALLSGAAGGDTQTVLRSVRENSVAALAEMRAMIDVLRDGDDEARTAPPRLRELDGLVSSASASGVPVVVDASSPEQLPTPVDLAAYRIVQEALTNVTKHAPGAATTVRVHGAAPLVVEVHNEFDGAAGPPGTGVVSMHERATAVGGTLTAGPDEDGWQVRAELPVGEAS